MGGEAARVAYDSRYTRVQQLKVRRRFGVLEGKPQLTDAQSRTTTVILASPFTSSRRTGSSFD